MLNLDVSQIIIQIIAFLVMLWVMKRYGWQPLLDTLKARRDTIQAEFESITTQREQVQQLTILYEEKLKGIDMDARKKIQEAVEMGRKISAQIQLDAQASAKEILAKAKSEMESEVDKAKIQLKNDIVNLVVNTTEKILQEKLDGSIQKKLIESFVEEARLK